MSYRIEKVEELLKEIVETLKEYDRKWEDSAEFFSWLFDKKPVQLRFVEKHVRNEETGNMEKKMEPKIVVVPTSNGHNQVRYLINMAKLSGLESMAYRVDDAINMVIDKTVNDEAYYIEDPRRNAIIKPFEYDFRFICKDYLTLPQNMQHKDTLLKFFENERMIENIGSLGYDVAKLLMTEFKGSLDSEDISKLIGYIESRLWKIEDRIRAIDNKVLDKEVKEAISRIVNDQPQGKAYTQDLINRLKKCNSGERHRIKAKYNRELSRYFELLEPYGESDEYVGENMELVNLYEDIKKTYDILNDDMYVEASRRHDESIKILKDYLANIKGSKKKPVKKPVGDKYQFMQGNRDMQPIVWTDEDIMD